MSARTHARVCMRVCVSVCVDVYGYMSVFFTRSSAFSSHRTHTHTHTQTRAQPETDTHRHTLTQKNTKKYAHVLQLEIIYSKLNFVRHKVKQNEIRTRETVLRQSNVLGTKIRPENNNSNPYLYSTYTMRRVLCMYASTTVKSVCICV